jgi:isocitrate dehydrogenase
MTKDNIMKQTDGLFRRVFEEIAREYPEVESEHMIIDIGAARLATRPERFDVVVTLNLYGDILSDIAAEVAGSVGLAGSANIGAGVSMFEAVHGSAPDIAGKNVANPSGLLSAATQMLVHVGQPQVAEVVSNAWLATIESGIHTADIFRPGNSRALVGTRELADAVIARLGEQPKVLRGANFASAAIALTPPTPRPAAERTLVGVDTFLCWDEADRNPEILAKSLEGALPAPWRLAMITNRGVKVYPDGLPETFKTDHWRCRLVQPDTAKIDFAAVLEALAALHRAGLEVIKTEHLYRVDGKAVYSLGQGE